MIIEFDEYGFQFETYWCYLSVSWPLLIVSALVILAYKIYKRKKNK